MNLNQEHWTNLLNSIPVNEPYLKITADENLTPLEQSVKKRISSVECSSRRCGKTIESVTTYFIYWLGEEKSKPYIKEAVKMLYRTFSV